MRSNIFFSKPTIYERDQLEAQKNNSENKASHTDLFWKISFGN